MNVLVAEIVTAFIVVTLSDGVAAALAARSCWRTIKARPKARPIAIPLGIFMAATALVDLSDLTNFLVNGVRNPAGAGAYQALAGRVVRSAATWYLALKLMNGYSSGHKESTHETTSEPNQADGGSTGPASLNDSGNWTTRV